MAEKIKIGGELDPRTPEKILGDASTIKDRAWETNHGDVVQTPNQKQDEINEYFQEQIDNIVATEQGGIQTDAAPTEGSVKLVQSGGTYTTIQNAATTAKTFLTGETVPAIGIDTNPTNNSTNLVKSGGVKTAIDDVAFSTNEKVKNVGIDDEPTAGSDNLVKSGGVQNELVLGAVYDVSAKNPTAGPNNDGKWESLSALLSDANLSTLIPIAYRKEGMSIRFVQSSDNTYMQYMYKVTDAATASMFTTLANWKETSLEGEIRQLEQKTGGEYPADFIVEQGSIFYESGEPIDSPYRLRTNFILGDTIRVSITTGKYSVYGYSNNDAIVYRTDTSQTADKIFHADQAVKFRVTFGYAIDANIEPSDFASLGASIYNIYDSEDSIRSILEEKVEVNCTNLVNPDKCTNGYGISDSTGKPTTDGATDLCVTDYIPVKGNNIISNGIFSQYWCGAVYDANKWFLRKLESSQYTYQSGDVYIRLTFNIANNKKANYGSVLTNESYNPIKGYLTEPLSDYLTKKYIEDNFVEQGYINLVDKTKFTLNKGISASTGNPESNDDLNLSDYIPVRGQNIISNSYSSNFWGGEVYDINKSKLRYLNTTQYTYQDGDYYIRLSFLNTNQYPRANYGTILASYSEFNPIQKYIGGILDDVNNIVTPITVDVEVLKNADTLNPHPIHLEVGEINLNNGKDKSSPNAIRSKDFFRLNNEVEPLVFATTDNNYYSVVRAFYYDDNGTYKGYMSTTGATRFRIVIYNCTENVENIKVYIDYSHLGLGDFILYTQGDFYKNISTNNAIDFANSKKKAIGKLSSDGTYMDELAASSIINNNHYSTCFVGYNEVNKRNDRNYENLNVVAINHDDMSYSDIVGNRKIYNKYGFHVNYNYILMPFESLFDKSTRIQNIKELVNDGHNLGLHSILNKSYWVVNKLFDIRPDSTFTFAPSLADIKGSNIDGTGVNAFGVYIDSTTKASSAYLNYPTNSVGNPNIVDMTQEQLVAITRCFTIYSDYQYTITGLDLEDNRVSKTIIGWLEYWYNNLIDSSLGYSSENTAIADRYADDYEYTEGGTLIDFYPDATHLKNGKLVFFDDTTNPNYNNADYQKVGRFTKGLFKGCASSCNYEVIERCIEVAEAIINHYYGVQYFMSMNPHGVGYFQYYYINQTNGLSYADRDFSFLEDFSQRTFSTKNMKWESIFDIFKKHNIRYTNYNKPENAQVEGQIGLYYGQDGIRSDFFNSISPGNGDMSYLNFFGTNASESMSYANFTTFLKNQDNWLKFAYEKAGESVTQNNKTYTVFSYIKHFLDIIRACKDTGKIPVFSYDTIMINPSISESINLISRYCYDNNIRIVHAEEARQLATTHRVVRNGNLFPNPAFNQSVLKYFGGTSTSQEANIPDSWYYGGNIYSVSVNTDIVNSSDEKVLSLTAGSSSAYLWCKIYALEPGEYTFSVYVKSSTNNGNLSFYINKNKDKVALSSKATYQTQNATNDWVQRTFDFTITENISREYDETDPFNIITQGYEDNVSNVQLVINATANGNIQISKPSIKRKCLN